MIQDRLIKAFCETEGGSKTVQVQLLSQGGGRKTTNGSMKPLRPYRKNFTDVGRVSKSKEKAWGEVTNPDNASATRKTIDDRPVFFDESTWSQTGTAGELGSKGGNRNSQPFRRPAGFTK